MDILSRYIIRKTSTWRVYDIHGGFIIIAIIFTIILPILLIILIVNRETIMWEFNWIIILENKSQDIIFHKFIFIFAIICFWWTMFLSVKLLRYILKINNVKNFKKSWWWIIKKIKISSIEHYVSYLRWWFNWYYLEANDGENIYLSNGIEKREVEWIAEKEYKSEIRWLLGNLAIKRKWQFSKDKKKTTETWCETPDIVVNWHKISVWDTVDVYIDPKDEKIYWMDIDFLFDK